MPVLPDELRERGWTENKIAVRVQPYIELNPYIAGAAVPTAEGSTPRSGVPSSQPDATQESTREHS